MLLRASALEFIAVIHLSEFAINEWQVMAVPYL